MPNTSKPKKRLRLADGEPAARLKVPYPIRKGKIGRDFQAIV